MANKYELMARLKAARQTSGKIAEEESQKAYPETKGKEKEAGCLMLPLPAENPSPAPLSTYTPEPANSQALRLEAPASATNGQAMPHEEQPPKKEQVTYTTISVPKQYGHKAKVYATLLNVNMVAFACSALDAYIHQLQEAEKLPRMDL